MTDQLTPADLAGMTPAEINTARRAGQLADILRGPATAEPTTPEPEPHHGPVVPTEGRTLPERPPTVLEAHHLETMTPQQINQARRDGRLNRLLGIQ